MMRRHFISLAMVGVLVLLLAGGAGAPGLWAADSKAISPAAPAGGPGGSAAKAVPAAPVGSPGGPSAKPLPAEAPPPAATYEYNPTGKSDPFAPFMETDPVLKAKQEEALRKKALAAKGRPISPLQQVEIDQLRLVGISGDDRRRTAIVEDGIAKKHYPLFVGTYIGMNGGRIVSIRPDRVIIEERLPGQSRKAKKPKVKRITVMLHKEDEGKP
ncbi:MAG: pilus assembly protein PilP [Deltaproteobacteria bacterium]|nr:pilus assembly protein PilP [Deltaproteobacteria bacterium]